MAKWACEIKVKISQRPAKPAQFGQCPVFRGKTKEGPDHSGEEDSDGNWG